MEEVKVKSYTKNKKQHSKFHVGEITLYQGNKVKIIAISYINTPQFMLYGKKEKGVYVLLEQLEQYGEEIYGWINQKRVKKLK